MSEVGKDLVFIASSGRTGTTFLGKALGDLIYDCRAVHEPDVLQSKHLFRLEPLLNFGLWHMVFGRLAGQTGVRVLGQRMLTGDLAAEVAYRRLRASRIRFHRRVKEPLIVESHGQWWHFAPDLPQIWPDAKLIAIIRDPRTWIRSMANYGGRYDAQDKASWLPPGRLTPAKLGQTALVERWRDWGGFEKLAWEWSVENARLTDAAERNENARLWRYEDLFGGDESHIADLVRFAAAHGRFEYQTRPVEGVTDMIVNASRGAAPDWPRWSGAQAAIVDELCGPLMQRFGYGREPEWLALVASA